MSDTHDTLIGPVPSRIVDSSRHQITRYEGRIAEFNVAVWLLLPGLANLPVTLLISYHDGKSCQEVNVDHCNVNGQGKVLLSGIARMPVKSHLTNVEVRLRSAIPANSLVVEELFVQAVDVIHEGETRALA